jgi:hypothetical protein
VSTCPIRYRFDGPGPASFLVEHGGRLRVYSRGVLSDPLSDRQVQALLTNQTRRWVAASGELVLETGDDGWLGLMGPMPIDTGEAAAETA